MKSDIEIARSIELRPITEISDKMGIPSDALEPYGKYMAKVPSSLIDEEKVKKSKLIHQKKLQTAKLQKNLRKAQKNKTLLYIIL